MMNIIKEIYNDVKQYWKFILIIGFALVLCSILDITVCPFYASTGVPCAGCGMTRAVKLLATGHFHEAYKMHAYIYVLLPGIMVLILMKYVFHTKAVWIKTFIGVILAGMLIYYVYRMALYFPGNEPMKYNSESYLNQLYKAIKCNFIQN